MADVPLSCQGQKHNTTKVKIREANNTYIVLINKRSACKKTTLNFSNSNMQQNQGNNSCWDFDNVRIIVSKTKKTKGKRRRRPKHGTHFITPDEYLKIMAKKCSTPDVHKDIHTGRRNTKRQRSDTYINRNTSFRTKCIINTVTLYPKKVPAECLPLLRHPLLQAQLRIYRYHFNEKHETCRCSCNSMSNIIKSLYDCHKEKHFDHFDFSRCGHLQLEERIFGEVKEMPERVVRETKDSIHINTISAGKVFEEREVEMGLANFSLKLSDAAILKNVNNNTPMQSKKCNTEIENEIGLQECCKMVLASPRLIKSENLYASKGSRLLLEKPSIERTNTFGVYSLNCLIPLEYKNATRESITDVIKNDLDLSQELLQLENKENCSRAEITKLITSIEKITKKSATEQIALSSGEKEEKPVTVNNKKSETTVFQTIEIEVNFNIRTKKVSSEILLRRRDATFMKPFDENMPEKKETMHRCKVKRSISLQDVKTVSEKQNLKGVRKDGVLFKDFKNTADRNKINMSSELDDTIRYNKLCVLENVNKSNEFFVDVDKDDDSTSTVVPASSFAKKKEIVEQLENVNKANEILVDVDKDDDSTSTVVPAASFAKKKELVEQLENVNKSNEILVDVDKDDDSTSTVVPASSFAKTKEIVEQKTTVESKFQSERPVNDASASVVIPLQENTTLDVTSKQNQHRRRGIPVPVNRIGARKKLVDKVKTSSVLSLPPKTTSGETPPTKITTLTIPLQEESGLDKQEILGSLAESNRVPAEEIDESEKEIIDNVENTTFLSNLDSEKQADVIVISPARDNSICSIDTSQVRPVERIKSKSLLDNNLSSKAERTYTFLEQTSSNKFKDDTALYRHITPLCEGKTSWDKVLTKKIKDELAVVKNPDAKLRKLRNSSFSKRSFKESNSILSDKVHSGMTSHGISLLDADAASKVKKDIDVLSAPKLLAKKERYPRTQYSKQFTLLDGKTDPEKEKILRALVGKGKPLPEGRTKAEKALIEKVRAETVLLSRSCFTTATERKNKTTPK